jgi:ribosomal RNA-processing protein 12
MLSLKSCALQKYFCFKLLSYYVKNASTEQLLKDDKLFSAKRAEGYVYSLWSLLPSCCNYPCDTSSNFRVLESVLCDTLQNQPELRGIVCSSIQVLLIGFIMLH